MLGGGRPLIPLSIVMIYTVYDEVLIEERKLMIHMFTIYYICYITYLSVRWVVSLYLKVLIFWDVSRSGFIWFHIFTPEYVINFSANEVLIFGARRELEFLVL